MSSSSSSRLTRYVSATTIVTADVANMWYGGLYGSSEAVLYDPNHPLVSGHVHDGAHKDGHAQKIHLVDHVTNQITNPNIADSAISPRNIKSYVSEANAIPYITTDGEYKLNLSMVTPSMGLGAFIEDTSGNLIRHTTEDYSLTGTDFVFGSSSLDDIGSGFTGIEVGDSRFLFDRNKSAFRAGIVSGEAVSSSGVSVSNLWDDVNRGEYSVAIGVNSNAFGKASVAFGNFNESVSDYSAVLSGSHGFVGNSSDFSLVSGGEDNSIESSDHSSILGGSSNSILNSEYSSVVGGENNDLQDSSYAAILGGKDNSLDNSNHSAIIGDTNVMDNADHSFVGGSGVGINTGGSTFVWGNDASLHSNIVTGSELFIIGTGSADENYQLGVNTHNPDVLGGRGAHIVGNSDPNSSPLRLDNLKYHESKNALCVDNDGNVFISDHELCEECGDFSGEITKTYWITDHNNSDDLDSKKAFNTDYDTSGITKTIAHSDLEIYEDGSDKSMFYQRARLRSEFASEIFGWTKPTIVIPFDMPAGQTLESITLIADGDLDGSDWTFNLNIFRQKLNGGSIIFSPIADDNPISYIGSDSHTYSHGAFVTTDRWFNFTFDSISDALGNPLVNAQYSRSGMNTYYAQFSYISTSGNPSEIPPENFWVLGMNVTTSFSTLAGALGAVLT